MHRCLVNIINGCEDQWYDVAELLPGSVVLVSLCRRQGERAPFGLVLLLASG